MGAYLLPQRKDKQWLGATDCNRVLTQWRQEGARVKLRIVGMCITVSTDGNVTGLKTLRGVQRCSDDGTVYGDEIHTTFGLNTVMRMCEVETYSRTGYYSVENKCGVLETRPSNGKARTAYLLVTNSPMVWGPGATEQMFVCDDFWLEADDSWEMGEPVCLRMLRPGMDVEWPNGIKATCGMQLALQLADIFRPKNIYIRYRKGVPTLQRKNFDIA